MFSREVSREVTFEELFEADLTGKTLEREVFTMKGITLFTTNKAVGIVKETSSSDNYRFLFPEEYEQCHERKCSHPDNDTSRLECFVDDFQGYSFAPWAKILIKEMIPVEEASNKEKEESMGNDLNG